MREKIVKYSAAGLCLICLIVLAGWFVVLPVLLSSVLPGVVNGAQNAVLVRQCRVASVGWNALQVRDVLADVPGMGNAEIDSLEVAYSPGELVRGHVAGIRARGVSLVLADTAFQDRGDAEHGEGIALERFPALPRVRVDDGVISLPVAGRRQEVRFGLEGGVEPGLTRARFSLRAEALGAVVAARGDADLNSGRAVMTLKLDRAALQEMARASGVLPEGVVVAGRGAGTVEAEHDLKQGRLRIHLVDMQVDSPVLLRKGQVLASAEGVSLSARQTADGLLHFDVSTRHLEAADLAARLHAAGRIRFAKRTEASMEYDLQLRDGADRELRAVGHARASVEQGEWSASAGCDVNGSVREFVLPQCVLQGEARGNGKQVALQWSLHGKPGALMPGDATIDFGPYRAQGELRGELGGSIAGPTDVRLETVRVRAGDAEGACAALSLSGTVRIAPEIGAELVLQGRNLSVKGKGFRVAGGKLSLPVQYPLETGEWGRLKVARIRAVGRELGSLDLRVRQNRDALDVQGAYLGELLPGLKASVTGRVEPFGSDLVRMRADVDSYELPGGFDLGRLAPQLQGVTGDGILMAWVGFGYGACGTSAQGEIYLTGGNLHDTENDVHVSGMRLSLYMPDLLTLRSAPLQSVAFDRLDFRGMRFDNGEVLFQAEERGAVVVETVTFDWLGGNIQSMPFRVVPGRDEYDLTLYCSNLRITELLEQLGFADARGEGRVSGRIPVSIRNGVVQFKAAQLQSSPDVGGNLRVRQAENLLAGVPASSPQYVQLRIASEALRDFEYRWAKVTASSNGEMLKVQLQLDGKPAGNLPFQYSRDFGFAEVSAEAEGMNFQGIRLDVNFNLPFDRMLRLRRVFGNNN